MARKILITGLTGSGKTTLAKALAPLIGAVVFDGDVIRNSYPNPVGFSAHDRALHAYHMGSLCEAVTASGNHAIASFICPTEHTRKCFDADVTILCSDKGDKLYPDTSSMWRDPVSPDLVCHKGHAPAYWASVAADMVQPVFNPMWATALLVGRWHPFHDGHRALVEKALTDVGQVCIGCRDTDRQWSFERVRQLIENGLRAHKGKFVVIPLPNITTIGYGRDVGYEIKKYELPSEIEAISGTKIRELTNS